MALARLGDGTFLVHDGDVGAIASMRVAATGFAQFISVPPLLHVVTLASLLL